LTVNVIGPGVAVGKTIVGEMVIGGTEVGRTEVGGTSAGVAAAPQADSTTAVKMNKAMTYNDMRFIVHFS
jgi:hypothetical protein